MTADSSFDIGEFPVLSEKQATIARLSLIGFTDPGTFSRATKYAAAGAVTEIGLRHNPTRLTGRVRGSGVALYVCTVAVEQGESGKVTGLRGACSCPVAEDCKHVFALVITAFREMQMRGGLQDGPESGVRFIQVLPDPTESPGQHRLSTVAVLRDAPAALQTAPTNLGQPARAAGGAPASRAQTVPPWLRSITGLLPESAPSDQSGEPLGLQVELVRQSISASQRRMTPSRQPVRIGLRPVLLGVKGKWIRTAISWQNHGMHGYRGKRSRADHVELLREISALNYVAGDRYNFDEDFIFLDGINNPRIWDLLVRGQAAGMAIVQSGHSQRHVVVSDGQAEIAVQVERLGEKIVLEPVLSVDGEPRPEVGFALLGDPLHGVAIWPQSDTSGPGLTLIPATQRITPELRQFLAGERLEIPGQDEEVFLRDYLPRLARRLPLVSNDHSIRIPQPQPPTLQLTVAGLPDHRINLLWQWLYRSGDTTSILPLVQSTARQPIAQPSPEQSSAQGRSAASSVAADAALRDPAAERIALQSLRLTPQERGLLTEPGPFGPKLMPVATLEGLDAVTFYRETLPRLRELPRVELTVTDEPSFREAASEPIISISSSQNRTDRDWFDLAITVSVDGEGIAFNALFTALAAGQEYLILPSGTYFHLGREQFENLRRLIEEARALQDVPSRSLRINRFQASLWEELTQLGVVQRQAAAWQKSVSGLLDGDQIVDRPVPAGLHATLRPYQQTGYNWLAFLYEHDLGGVLADDMGLGKTIQTLALICHARAERPGAEPFLVVAPTSVVGNWAAECMKFAPGLRVVPITETSTRSGTELRELVSGADIVVTSYALFRIQFDDYAAQSWSGLVLDEAQFIKNHLSKGYQCAKKLSVPFKLAITGTPMENNLMELWSLFSVTSPGLFSLPARFKDYYQNPIEKSGDSARLEQLRRRVRPLMLRRTKEQVVKDLPAKQEQIIELELNPKHRKVYQMHLQRERQKVLGLIEDLKKNRFAIFRSLTVLRQLSLDASLVDTRYAGIPSTKLDALMEQVRDIVDEGHRTLIFSQFTGFLEKVRQRMDAAGVEYCYLDGSTRDRPAVLAEFKTGSAPVFLISLKAGGVGLNLTEADYCILLDPWWNPATEAQAIDRVHRIGQTKKVMVYRLVAKDTIEEKVMALKATKAKLFSSVMDAGSAQSTALTAGDIRELLS